MPEPLRWDMTLPNGQPLRWDMGPEYTWDGNVPASAYPPTAMQQNDIAITITPAQETAFNAAAQALTDLIAAFTVTITDAQRATYFKLGDARLAFHNKCRDYMHQQPGTVPPTVNLTEYDKDETSRNAVDRMIAKANTILQPLVDTQTVLGADLLDADLSYYNYLPLAANAGQAGAQDIHGDLKTSYPGGRRPKPPAPPAPHP